MNNDLKRVLKALEKAGYEVSRTNRGHWEVRWSGVRVTTFSGTPSDRRAWLNSLAPLKRRGFTWPPRG